MCRPARSVEGDREEEEVVVVVGVVVVVKSKAEQSKSKATSRLRAYADGEGSDRDGGTSLLGGITTENYSSADHSHVGLLPSDAIFSAKSHTTCTEWYETTQAIEMELPISRLAFQMHIYIYLYL